MNPNQKKLICKRRIILIAVVWVHLFFISTSLFAQPDKISQLKTELADAEKVLAEAKTEDLKKVGRWRLRITLSVLLDELRNWQKFDEMRFFANRLLMTAQTDNAAEDEATALETLGEIETQNYQHQTAFNFFDKALAIRQKSNVGSWKALSQMALAHRYFGEFEAALQKYDEAIEVLKSQENSNLKPFDLITKEGEICNALFGKAFLQALRGKFKSARELLSEIEKSLSVFSNNVNLISDKNLKIEAARLAKIITAQVFQLRGQLGEATENLPNAEQNYLLAITILEKLNDETTTPTLGILYHKLAQIYHRNGDFQKARENAEAAFRLHSQLQNKRGMVLSLLTLARLTANTQNHLQKAKEIIRNLDSPDLTAELNETEADLIAENSSAKAIEFYQLAVTAYRQLEMRPYLVRALNSLGRTLVKAGQFSEAEKIWREAIEIIESIRHDFSSPAESEPFTNRQDNLRIYARLIDFYLSQSRPVEALQIAVRAQSWELVQALPIEDLKLNNLNELTQAVRRERILRADLSRKLPIEKIRLARQNFDSALQKLSTQNPNLRLSISPIDFSNLQTAPHEATIFYLATAEKLYLFVLSGKKVSVKTVLLKPQELENLIDELHSAIKNYSIDFIDSAETEKQYEIVFKTISAQLFDKLIAPIQESLNDAKTLKIVPNDKLFSVPFAALFSAQTNKYLIEDFSLVWLSAGDLKRKSNVLKGNIVAFGNPTEANLRAAEEEVKLIRQYFPKSQIFIGNNATKTRLFSVKVAKILHFATHGNILDPVEESNIQLAHLPLDQNPDLSFGEIYSLPLSESEIVVLSACQTALGRAPGAKFGVFVEAFLTKTRTIAATLWKVDDIATREQMSEFYKNLAHGKSRADSLRAAQLKILRNSKLKHPFYWAAFVLYGADGKI